ncbi:MAG: archaeosortase/exosortase family protein [Isosphaerales bacterium]
MRFPHALLLIPLGTALSWVANVGRIAALIVVGDQGWPGVAAGGFHSQAGWLAFNGIALGLFVLARRVRVFSKFEPIAETEPAAMVNPTAAYLGRVHRCCHAHGQCQPGHGHHRDGEQPRRLQAPHQRTERYLQLGGRLQRRRQQQFGPEPLRRRARDGEQGQPVHRHDAWGERGPRQPHHQRDQVPGPDRERLLGR